MGTKAERRAARELVGAYHEDQLVRLFAHVEDAISRFRAGEVDAYDVDQAMYQYSRATKALWKFCNLTDIEFATRQVREDPPSDWWERGEPRRR